MEGVSAVPELVAESHESMSTDQSSRSSKKRAKVWEHIESEVVDGIEKAICKYCRTQLSLVAGKGTSHLNRHIGYHCPQITQEDRDRFLATLKMLLAIRDVLLDETWNTNELLNELADKMHTKFQKYWTNPNIALLIAAVLDPSMKTDFIKFYFHTIGEHVDLKMRELKRYLKKYYQEYEKIVRINNLPVVNVSDEQVMSESVQSGTSSLGLVCGKRRVEFAFVQFASQNSDARSERSELDIYLEDPRILVRSDENFNVLAWWKKNSDAYPILSLMARDFLAIPVSTVFSESAFSAAGRILGKDRTSLSPETLEALICTKDWLIGFNDEEEGESMSEKRMFGSDDDEDDE